MKKLFVSTSFSFHIDPETGNVQPEFRQKIEAVLSALRKTGEFEVFCAIEKEGWIISDAGSEISVEEDINEVDKAEILLAILQDRPSAGVQFEMGYAVGKGKQVLVATEIENKLAYFNSGLAKLGKVTHISFNKPQLLAEEVKNRMHD